MIDMNILLNFLAFKIGWLACVVGAIAAGLLLMAAAEFRAGRHQQRLMHLLIACIGCSLVARLVTAGARA